VKEEEEAKGSERRKEDDEELKIGYNCKKRKMDGLVFKKRSNSVATHPVKIKTG
jgi:hypothetical protein